MKVKIENNGGKETGWVESSKRLRGIKQEAQVGWARDDVGWKKFVEKEV